MKNYSLHIPEGVRDYIGEEAALKDNIQNKIKKIFRTNGYNLVETPSFEYLDVFAVGEESYQTPNLYHLVSRQGELMALKSDLTRSIARVVGTQKGDQEAVQRFCYLANCFRYPERYQGKLHEFTQAGVELIGNDSLEADAEVINVAVKALKAVGTTEFTVHIGNSKFLEYTLEDLGLDEEKKQEVIATLAKKDAVTLKKILRESDMDSDTLDMLLELIECTGNIELVRNLRNKIPSLRVKLLISDMEKLYNMLEDYGVDEHITFDFNLFAYGKYYTGTMFQIFADNVGAAIAEGGRYDNLLANFGKDLPAVGFGIHVNLLMQRLIKQRNLTQRQSKKTLVVCSPVTRRVCSEVSDELRNSDLVLENFLGEDINEAVKYAKAAGLGGILHFKHGDKVDVYNLENGTVKETSISQL